MTTVVVLGATGNLGRAVVDQLGARGLPVLAAARRREALEQLAKTAASPLRTAWLGAWDVDALRSVCTSASVVINCVGPYARLGHVAVQACQSAGVPLVDSSGEQAWIARVLALTDARSTIVTGAGVEVGLTAWLADTLAEGLPTIDEVAIAAQGIGFRPSVATSKSALGIAAEDTWRYTDGALRRETGAPSWPLGEGRSGVWIPGGENLTLPRHVPCRAVRTMAVVPSPLAVVAPLLRKTFGASARHPVLRSLLERTIDAVVSRLGAAGTFSLEVTVTRGTERRVATCTGRVWPASAEAVVVAALAAMARPTLGPTTSAELLSGRDALALMSAIEVRWE